MHPEEVPDGYPRDLERWVKLPGGEAIFLRPILPVDVPRLEYAFAHADIETVRRRFFTAAPPTDRAHLQYLTTVDYSSRLALIAMDTTGESIGIGRYEGGVDVVGEGVAEVAIVVAPTWRRKGVGATLLLALEAPAMSHGIGTFSALYLPSNTGVERLLLSIGYSGRTVTDGIATLIKPLR
jgi:GNAT superfamily N-acetyltransferase